MKKEPVAWLYEEFDIRSGDLLKSHLWSFHPKELSLGVCVRMVQ